MELHKWVMEYLRITGDLDDIARICAGSIEALTRVLRNIKQNDPVIPRTQTAQPLK